MTASASVTLAVAAVIGQLGFFAAYICYAYRARVTFVSAFASLHLVLQGTCFALMTCHVAGLIDLWSFLQPNYEELYRLSLGNGLKPTCYILLIQLGFTMAAFLTHRFINRNGARSALTPVVNDARSDRNRLNRYFYAALLLFGGALLYKVVRIVWLHDLPLLVALREGIRPQTATMMNSIRKDVPYLLLPSIDRQVYLVVLPLCTAVFGLLWEKMRTRGSLLLLLFSTATTFFFLLGHLKRTPFLMVALYFLVFAAIYGFRRYRFLAATGLAFAMFGLFGMTTAYQLFIFYSHNEPPAAAQVEAGPERGPRVTSIGRRVAGSVASRVLLGEAIEDYVVVEHFGTTIEHTGTTYIRNYMNRVAGGRAKTLAERLSIELTGLDNGVSTSTGICLEFHAAFGLFFAVLVAAAAGALFTSLDHFALRTSAWEYHPVIAALVVTTGTMSVKGFFSMFFTGGTLLLLLLAASLYVLRRLPATAWASAPSAARSTAGRAPVPVGSGKSE